MSWTTAIVVSVAVFMAVGIAGRLLGRRRRDRAARMPAGTVVVREATDVSVRIYVDRDVVAGPSGGRINRGSARLVLTDRVLVLATQHGRVLEIGTRATGMAAPGKARFAGPRRLVVQGEHPSGGAWIRAELVIDDAEGWAAAIGRLPNADEDAG